ncbi:MAG: hypothetical protein MJ247_04160 [Alphaproteobacteria bacterium]|nr:hypothetical protein [Alphaproteobacteria bacterium]
MQLPFFEITSFALFAFGICGIFIYKDRQIRILIYSSMIVLAASINFIKADLFFNQKDGVSISFMGLCVECVYLVCILSMMINYVRQVELKNTEGE